VRISAVNARLRLEVAKLFVLKMGRWLNRAQTSLVARAVSVSAAPFEVVVPCVVAAKPVIERLIRLK